MKRRKAKSKLLVHFLNLAESGDRQAEVQAKELAKEIFKEEQEVKLTEKSLASQQAIED
ncbi:hypothetical protein JZO66_15460 [Enterococcus sp. DIV0242_7C1]|uniref:Uncharacterized protein n=1 Tax=Candidatus Enterococcus dunnyi TaxID=1834192 RepID=A0A200J8M2_9ENTE|nr:MULTISPECIES: hypothetical protein [unclassified Enterococcus]MBO0471955.1 hypothetical protein [Enterococcus sp. DIV0242_7C1]OUZ33582.1 hypothetical protein A5889_002297 [Enterococcus sp. 9D6_DIV0238]